MYKESYYKTFILLAIALFMGIGVSALFEPVEGLTGNIVDTSDSTSIVAWPEFFVGFFIGMIILGLVAGLWYHEHTKIH